MGDMIGPSVCITREERETQRETDPCGRELHAIELAAMTFGLSYAGCARIGWSTERGLIHSRL